jgi:hypothetical protein
VVHSHLDRLLINQNGITSAQVASCDVVNYSCRKSSVQRKIVDKLQEDVTLSLADTSASYADYARVNEIELNDDVVKLATGDGIALVFTFKGLHSIAMDFSIRLLRRIQEYNSEHSCEKFLRDHWCDCHRSYHVRIGLADGKCILYRDINNLVNAAGNAINTATRVMNKAHASQILITKRCRERLIDQPTSIEMEGHLVYVGEGRFKHGQIIDVWQYVDPTVTYLNSSVVTNLAVSSHLETLLARMDRISIIQAFVDMEWDKIYPDTALKLLGLVEQMLDLVHGSSEISLERIVAVPNA